jgi:hypothetical protein
MTKGLMLSRFVTTFAVNADVFIFLSCFST